MGLGMRRAGVCWELEARDVQNWTNRKLGGVDRDIVGRMQLERKMLLVPHLESC